MNPVVICLLLILFALGTAWWGAAVDPAARWSWLPLFVSAGALNAFAAYLVVLLGIDQVQRRQRKEEIRKERLERLAFWGAFKEQGVLIVFGGTLGTMRDDAVQKSSVATIKCLEDLEGLLTSIFDEDIPVRKHPFGSLSANRVVEATQHVVLLGGYLSIRSLETLPARAGFTYYQDFNDSTRRKVCVSPQNTLVSEISDGKVVCDYAIITVAVEKNTGRKLVWVSGNYGLGTYGAIIAATKERKPLKLEVPEPGEFTQIVLKIANIEEEWIQPDHEDYTICAKTKATMADDFKIAWVWEGQP